MTAQRSCRYYEFVMAAFVTAPIRSNLIGPAKIAQVDLPLFGAPAPFWTHQGACEVAFTPVTCKTVKFHKRAENEDYCNRNTNLSPFAMKP